MKRIAIFFVIAVLCGGIGWAAYPDDATPQQTLSKYVPPGPLLYLEAKDFSALLADWNSSAQKRQWIASGNYEVFSRSRLLLRLAGAGNQFAAAAGLPPNMSFLSQVAGTRSALALYDVGNLQFLYITYLPSAKSMETALWQSRSKFERRNSGGVDFYLRRDPESQKEVAFAVSGDYLLLATREDLLAGALQLMAGSPNRTLETEHWWSQSVASAGPAGDLRMVLNLEKLVPSPYFRTYWVQQNVTDMKQYSAAISDLFCSGKLFREERILTRKTPSAEEFSANELQAAADLVRLAPEGAGLYEAKAHPAADSAFDLLRSKLLAPHLGPAPASETAPQAQLTSGEAGSGSDMETRIDQSPAQRSAAGQNRTTLQDLLDKTQLHASLQVQSTEHDNSSVFVRFHSGVVLEAASDWNQASVRGALSDFVRPNLTAGNLGVAWQQKSGYEEFNGLLPLMVSVRGKYLFVSDDENLITAMLVNSSRKTEAAPAIFLAGFNHSSERANFARLFSVIDRPGLRQPGFPGMDRQPEFFAGNMASLSSTLAAVAREHIVVRPDGDKVRETVTYEWSQ